MTKYTLPQSNNRTGINEALPNITVITVPIITTIVITANHMPTLQSLYNLPAKAFINNTANNTIIAMPMVYSLLPSEVHLL